jgi:hypothetical protein
VLAAVRPTAARASLAMVAVTVLVAAAPLLVRSALGLRVGSVLLVIPSVAAGAAVGWATDDPGREVLGSLPVPSSLRTSIRFAAAALVSSAGLFATVAIAAAGPGLPAGQGARIPEALAAGALACGLGLVATRRGEPATGPVAVTAGFGAVAVIGVLAIRWPRLFPSFDAGPVHDRWWLVATVGGGVALWAGRDPGR